MDQQMAKHSFSMVLYLVSLFESFQLRDSTGRSSPPTTWDRTAPSPLSNASVCNTKGTLKLGACKSVLPHRAAFTLITRPLTLDQIWCFLDFVHDTMKGGESFQYGAV